MLITPEYQELNKKLHVSNPAYGTSGERVAGDIMKLAATLNTQDILDYGCGKSTLANQLPFEINQYDPAIFAYSAPPEPAELVVCTDVLEHIEPECMDDVIADLTRLTKRVLYISVACIPAKKTLEDGRNAHISLHPFLWWYQKFDTNFQLLEMRGYFEEHQMKFFKGALYKR